jgi:ElaB/YqjD/DUF883 family membrane-anchored ribosome-binding protein
MSQTKLQMDLSKQKIMQDFRVLLADAQELVKLTSSASGQGLDLLREKLRGHAETAKSALGETHATTRARAREVADNADVYVRSNPWQAVGIGVGVGLVLGMLISR